MSNWQYSRARFQRGISLVELMVAAVIGLVSMLVLMQVGINFEGQKRTTVGAGGAVDSSSVVLSQLRRDLAVAGNGLNHVDSIGCTLSVFRQSNGSALVVNPLLPVAITPGPVGGSATLDIRAGDIRRFVETGLFSNHPGDTSPYVTDSNYGFIKGDVFLVVEPGAAACVLGEVSGAAANSTDVQHVPAGMRFNNPAGTGIGFTGAARLINIGPGPTFIRYSVVNGALNRSELLTQTNDDILEDVLVFQAQYGFNTVASGLRWSSLTLDADGDGITGDDDDWLRLTAVRIAIVIRQEPMDKPDSEGRCSTSDPTVKWSFGSYDLNAVPNGRCYRYRVAETVVPIRNLIWSQK